MKSFMFKKGENGLLCHHGALALVIALLLGLILMVLVFKVGVMVGGSKSHLSSYRMGDCQKYFKKYTTEKYEAKAEAMGMTMEEFKKYLAEQIE